MLLLWKDIAQTLKTKQTLQVAELFGDQKKYFALIFLWDNTASKTYVQLKKKYAESIWLKVEIFWQEEYKDTDNSVLKLYKNETYDTAAKVIELIHYLNYDPGCVGIIVQLPLPESLEPYKAQILSTIAPHKDPDGLWGVLNWLSEIDLINFIPATPKAVFVLLDEYKLGDMKWKSVAILWQSNLVGKPLAMECIKRWANVHSFNSSNDVSEIKEVCLLADYIFSCTGKIHLVDETFIRKDKIQILVDVWYGHKDGKAVWDIQRETLQDKVAAITPVPWGVWPLTVACIFENIFLLQTYKDILKKYYKV